MSTVLTPEEICELDTFTLEEKIEQLQTLPNSALYSELLRIAKLQLIDRLEVEDFGMRLANDEFAIDLDFKLPPIVPLQSPPAPKNLLTPAPLSVESRTKFIQNWKQAIPQPATSFVTVGRPAVNYRYKPKVKKVQHIDPTKNFLKAKKNDSVKSKPKKATAKQIVQTVDVPASMKVIEGLKNVKQIPQVIGKTGHIQECSLKQKLKKEVKQMKVVYIENDVYQDFKQITIPKLNLFEEEMRLKECKQKDETIPTEFEYQSRGQLQQELMPVRHSANGEQESIKVEVCELILEEVRQESHGRQQFKLQDSKEKVESHAECIDDPPRENNAHDIEKVWMQPPSKEAPQLGDCKDQAPKIQTKTKQIRSQSMKSLAKKPIEVDTVDLGMRINLEEPKVSFKKQKYPRLGGTSYGTMRPFVERQIFPYHETVPSFSKLFPHSRNILVTLRNVESSLQAHFQKNVDQKSIEGDHRRVDEDDVTFKVISESQRAQKYRNLYNIQIDSYIERGSVMLSRLKSKERVKDSLFYRVVRTKEQVYDIINSSFHRTRNWLQLPHGLELKSSWNLLWTWSRPQIDFTDLFLFQKVNHFIGNKQLARKDLLKKNIQHIQKLGPKMKKLFDIIPETYLLPGENMAFIQKFRENSLKDPINYWILKPVGLSRGRGIELIKNLEQVVFSEPVVLQKYLSNPLLVDGFKFDMRIYVLVTSMNPLQAYIYKEGFARMSTERYSLKEEDLQNKLIHLTNFSVQRHNVREESKSFEEEFGGCKISLKMLADKLGDSWAGIQKQIQQIVVKSLVACMKSIPNNPNCFEVFGYDIIVDQDMKCWLLEVNSSPSLEKEYPLDEVVKQQMVDDALQLLQPLPYDRSRLLQVVERRRKEAEGLKSAISTTTNSPIQLDMDLDYILHSHPLPALGQPRCHHNFITVAPSPTYQLILKHLQHYKIDPIVKQQ